jgi:4-hydroxybenzoate polyprenyltransferase
MGAPAACGVRPRRSRGRAYLALARFSNLPTVWTNVLAGMAIASATLDPVAFATAAAAMSALYTGGMFLNDAFDHRIDAASRPDRPIPAGEVTLADAVAGGALLIGSALVLLGIMGAKPMVWGIGLSALIIYYDWRHKRDPLGPLVMGLCRGLVYCTAAAAVAGVVSQPVVLSSVAVTIYVMSLTLLAKYGDRRWGWTVGWWIAGISVVDAAAIASAGRPALALLALTGFPLTLLAQRWVRGT